MKILRNVTDKLNHATLNIFVVASLSLVDNELELNYDFDIILRNLFILNIY